MTVLVRRPRAIRSRRNGQSLRFDDGERRAEIVCRNAQIARRTVAMVERVRTLFPAWDFVRVINTALVAVDREREIEAGVELHMGAGLSEAQAFERALFEHECAMRFRQRTRRVPRYGRRT